MTAAAQPIHAATLNRGVETLLRTQEDTFKVARRMAVQLRTDKLGSELHEPFAQLIALLAEQNDAIGTLARALAERSDTTAAVTIATPRDVVAQSASLQELDNLASSLTLA